MSGHQRSSSFAPNMRIWWRISKVEVPIGCIILERRYGKAIFIMMRISIFAVNFYDTFTMACICFGALMFWNNGPNPRRVWLTWQVGLWFTPPGYTQMYPMPIAMTIPIRCRDSFLLLRMKVPWFVCSWVRPRFSLFCTDMLVAAFLVTVQFTVANLVWAYSSCLQIYILWCVVDIHT